MRSSTNSTSTAILRSRVWRDGKKFLRTMTFDPWPPPNRTSNFTNASYTVEKCWKTFRKLKKKKKKLRNVSFQEILVIFPKKKEKKKFNSFISFRIVIKKKLLLSFRLIHSNKSGRKKRIKGRGGEKKRKIRTSLS